MNKKFLTAITVVIILVLSISFAIVAFNLPENKKGENPSTESTASQTNETDTEDTQDKVTADTTPPLIDNKFQFTTAPEGYFDDALFIGDSRTVGLNEYGGIDGATFFASSGLSVYKIDKEQISVENVGKVTLSDLLKNKKYGKIYVMIGINELGYDFKTSIEKYSALIDSIQKEQPNAVFFICANLHVSKTMSDDSEIYNNSKINAFNSEIKKLSERENTFYLDVNEIFDDSEGNLDSQYTYDNSHLLGRYYRTWAEWLSKKAIVK